MNVKFALFYTLLVFFLGAYLHEKDIQRACDQLGKSGLSTWIKEIECHQINK